MRYRTRTYLAAEWDGDKDLVDELRKWNASNHWSLHFLDAHNLGEARDASLNCSIKSSLSERLRRSKTFVLIVGKKTDSVTAGSCLYCSWYRDFCCSRSRSNSVSFQSYIKYECNYAARNIPNIIVLYNSTYVDKKLCPEVLKNRGKHIAAKKRDYAGRVVWDYESIKSALERNWRF